MPVAARAMAWARGMRNAPGPQQGASLRGVPFLADQLGTASRLTVEVAWGANPAADSATWSWTDVTADVRQANSQGITVTQLRADETSTAQAANCAFELANTTGNYSPYLPTGVNYPNVRRNTPIRVTVDPGSGTFTRFYGYANGFVPG